MMTVCSVASRHEPLLSIGAEPNGRELLIDVAGIGVSFVRELGLQLATLRTIRQ